MPENNQTTLSQMPPAISDRKMKLPKSKIGIIFVSVYLTIIFANLISLFFSEGEGLSGLGKFIVVFWGTSPFSFLMTLGVTGIMNFSHMIIPILIGAIINGFIVYLLGKGIGNLWKSNREKNLNVKSYKLPIILAAGYVISVLVSQFVRFMALDCPSQPFLCNGQSWIVLGIPGSLILFAFLGVLMDIGIFDFNYPDTSWYYISVLVGSLLNAVIIYYVAKYLMIRLIRPKIANINTQYDQRQS